MIVLSDDIEFIKYNKYIEIYANRKYELIFQGR